MSFFIKDKKINGLKRSKYTANNKKEKPKKSPKDEEISSSEDEDPVNKHIPDATSSEDENETAQDKKLRLAKLYLKEIEREEKARLEREEIDETVISNRLKEDYLKETGRLRLTVADNYESCNENNIIVLKCREQNNCVTCLCISNDNKFIYSGSKDGVVIKYCLNDYKKVGVIPFGRGPQTTVSGHSSQITCIAISSDDKYLVTSDKNSKSIFIWNPDTLRHIKTLTGHKNTILGLCFKKDSHTLYSCSRDKTAKVWSLDEMAYVETLFGHQDGVTSIDALHRDRAVTSGGRDLRVWKIPEETQLIFNGHNGNIDNVRLINEENFVSGGDDGQICVWSVMRKKPLISIQNAHGLDPTNDQPNWVTSVCALLNTDLIASGSMDGFVRFWKLENNFKSSKLIFKASVQGFVNCMNFTNDGNNLIVAISKEYRLGRWNTVKNAKNCVLIIPLIKKQ